MEIIKTIQWTAESPGIFALCAKVCKLGEADIAHPKNFVEFIASYSHCSCKDLVTFVNRWLTNDRFKNANVTLFATLSEDMCLFRTYGIHTAALDIVLRYLDILRSGKDIPAMWAYLDQEKKAVVHFVNRQGFYAELYCQTTENCSVLHLIEHNGQKLFVPVIFTPQLSADVIKQTQAAGNHYLHDYLPREKYDCLSKGGKKNSGWKTFPKGTQVKQPVSHTSDSWDNL